ncbi:SIMPL domain-containing protein [Gordonia sp. OPL2]|uniref:SIMPL domain-containing protein n=1 Tax=Gordonia sp. OPL2 TaxID=2486274 RepID=UPI0016566A27|nr:SIMPL domain-containing protein [Gordonia sp. OPL2]RPA10388.1 DUF541 domain-containing protein [Gordonia sp. OPL2]
MTPLEIVVRGRANRKYRPERAILHLTVHLEGDTRETVHRDSVAVHATLVEDITGLAAAGTVTTWSSDSVRVTSHRPYDRDGEQREMVYVSRIGLDVEFGDFDALSECTERWGALDGVDIGGVHWDVTDENRRIYERDLRRAAVDDAVAKAQAYADAVGRGAVVATQLADPGMLAEPSNASMAVRAMPLGAPPPGGGPSLELRSDDIEIGMSVDARFVAE